jgi:hypothetical protein
LQGFLLQVEVSSCTKLTSQNGLVDFLDAELLADAIATSRHSGRIGICPCRLNPNDNFWSVDIDAALTAA